MQRLIFTRLNERRFPTPSELDAATTRHPVLYVSVTKSVLNTPGWLALGVTPFDNDFIELYNADPSPVALGGLYLSDETLGWRERHQIAALSFIPGYGYLRFFADGAPDQGPEHLSFNLSGDQGAIGLYLPDLTPIDQILYQAQRLEEQRQLEAAVHGVRETFGVKR